MRVEIDWQGAAADAVRPWMADLDWSCAGRRLHLRVFAAAAVALPAAEASEPPEAAVARVLRTLHGSGALVALLNPAQALGAGRMAFAAGCRLLGVGGDADLACWDELLAGGQPCYGLRGRCFAELRRPEPGAALAALAYGAFVCEDGLAVTALDESREGVAVAVAREAEFAVIARGGFEARRQRGTRLDWRDGGGEGVVRVEARAADGGACWTQPRLIAPRPGAAHG